MKKSYKKLILVIIVLIEIILGSIFLSVFIHKRRENNRIVTVINKEMVSESPTDKAEYYWKFDPGEWTEQPKWLDHEITYKINNDGLRENINFLVKKPKSVYRIITLGDSFTYGLHVAVEESWPKKLEKKISLKKEKCGYENFEVINLGMSGFDVEYIVKRYKDLGQKYNPNLILWFESGSGFHRYIDLTRSLTTKCYESSSDAQKLEDEEKFYKYDRCGAKVTNKLIEEYSLFGLFELNKENYQNYFNLKNTSNTIIFANHNIEEAYTELVDNWRSTFPDKDFLSFVPDFKQSEIFIDDHPNEIGHEIIAKSIFNYLEEENIICN